MSRLRTVLSDFALSIIGRLKNITGRDNNHDVLLARLSLFLAGILVAVLMLGIVYFMIVMALRTFLFEPYWANLLVVLFVIIVVSRAGFTVSSERIAKTYDKLDCNSITTESWFD